MAFRPALLTGGDGDYDAQNRNNRELARAIERLQLPGVVAATSPGTRVFVSTVTGVGPWAFTGLNGDEAGLLGYEFELAIIDPAGDIYLRLNGDAGANYGDISGIARNQADVAVNPGGPPGGVRGVVELRGVATGNARTIGTARVTSFDLSPTVAVTPGDFNWTGVAALASASFSDSGGASAASSQVSLFKVMRA